MSVFIGIDPGVSGGVAFNWSSCYSVVKMPETPQELAQLIRKECCIDGEPVWAFVERVASSPQMGVVSSFTFGRGYGTILGVLAALEIPYDLVTPTVWQKAMGCLTRGDKSVSKLKAAAMFPKVKVTNWGADALLLAEYCRRQRGLQQPA